MSLSTRFYLENAYFLQNKVYPFNLTNPETVPQSNTDPHLLPPVASSSRLLTEAVNQIQSIATNPVFGTDTCAQCQAILEVAKFLSLAAPSQGPAFFIELCETLKLSSSCAVTYALNGIGSVLTQVAANADVGNYDGQVPGSYVILTPNCPHYPIDVVSEFLQHVPPPSDVPAQPHRLVRKTETKPIAPSKTALRQEAQGVAYL